MEENQNKIEQIKKTAFSKKLAIWVVAFHFGLTIAMVALVCLLPHTSTGLLAIYGTFSAIPAGVVLSYYKNARIENVEKIKLNPTYLLDGGFYTEGGDI